MKKIEQAIELEGHHRDVLCVLDYGVRNAEAPEVRDFATVYYSGRDAIADDLIVDLCAYAARQIAGEDEVCANELNNRAFLNVGTV